MIDAKMESLLKKRIELKKKKPVFMRQDAHKKKKLRPNWRKPKGSDSKMRVFRKGYRRSVRIGWGSPRAVFGLSREGLRPVEVGNPSQLESLDPKFDCIIIRSSVGLKKRLDIVQLAITKGLKVMNVKDPAHYLEEQKKLLKEKKEKNENKKKSRSEKREKAKKEAEKQKAKKEAEKKAAESKTEEEKKSEEKKEMDKVLTQKQ